jgi:peptidoglycan/LPS O-acetylase OafA/YrhL
MNDTAKLEPIPEFASGKRFKLVDALRGIAALAVLCHHLLFNSELQVTLWQVLPGWFAEFCHSGAFGVEIFFVLSGFVITHSLRNVALNAKGVGNFMLRRQLRLDPPYWTLLALTIASIYVERHFSWIVPRPIPTFYEVWTNMFYLHNILGANQIMSVSWTLCLEVQFYLVFIILLVAGKYMSPSGKNALNFSAALVALLAIASLIAPLVLPVHAISVWFLLWWYYFAAGALCYWAVTTPRFRLPFIGFLALFFAFALFFSFTKVQETKPMFIGWSTALLLFTAGRMGKLTTWLDFPPLQYLGRISYSLYLSHLLVAVYVLRIGYRVSKTSHAGAVFWFFMAGAVSIAAAHVIYLLVERSSVRFAAGFKPARQKEPTQPGSGATPVISDNLEELQNA